MNGIINNSRGRKVVNMNKLLVTGSSGLIGSEVVTYFCEQGWDVWGIDNNQRANFFGPAGDTRWNQRRLQALYKRFRHQELDVRDRNGVASCIEALRPALIVHAAAQPSHDLAAKRPFDDFDTNAVGTMNMLEAARRHEIAGSGGEELGERADIGAGGMSANRTRYGRGVSIRPIRVLRPGRCAAPHGVHPSRGGHSLESRS